LQTPHTRPRAHAAYLRRQRVQPHTSPPHPILPDPRLQARGRREALLRSPARLRGAPAPGVHALEAPPPHRGDGVGDGHRRVLPATGGLLMKGRHPRDSETVMSELMMPQHANIMGNVFGGVVLSLVDRVAAVAAIRHSNRQCVTVSVDKVDFREPIHVGELLTAYGRVNFAGKTSMEVGVKVLSENPLTGQKRHTNS